MTQSTDMAQGAGVFLGADTHEASHTLAAVAATGLELGWREFPANGAGYAAGLEWALTFGPVVRAGVESTGSYGAGLCAHLMAAGVEVWDVRAPDKPRRRLEGKYDAEDARQAAQAALSLTRCSPAKDRDAEVAALTDMEGAYELAVRQRTATVNALRALVVKLPDALRQRLRGKTARALADACAALKASAAAGCAGGTVEALKSYAKAYRALDGEARRLDREIGRLAREMLPATTAVFGIGCHAAATLLGAAGANIGRMSGESAFAMLCGASPIPASSGNKSRHRLNRGGNRKANSALHTAAVVRLHWDARAREYVGRKMSEGKTKKDAIRALKRYIARDAYYALLADLRMLGLVA